ncbi:ATP-binding cassette domain-containing protein [Telluribacter sp. SYSU D00476]|uniref:ABC transporter ATP-binding protein n=1 Tax=Telluribacter sp. SYSU D00476 TaxID=2811430 RepID=UPI001FF683ED|nr:ABC transporter ATP-binding protein [Telluribacter sp. SYSU D00476]
MIRFDHVSFGYSKQNLLFENLSMELLPGQIYGLLGKNGAGKSSLLRTMAGLLFPLGGDISVNGHKPEDRQPAFLQDIFFIPEEIYLPAVTIDRYIATYAPFYPGFDERQFHFYINNFDIPQKNKLTGMSYGQKKKVLTAFALATNTKVLLMDEPTNGLDIPSKSQFRRIVSSALTPDRLFVISTHQVRDLDNLIDSILILENSELVVQHSLTVVAERLHFGNQVDIGDDELVIYSEPSLRGYKVIAENAQCEESRVDLEQLFNAAVLNPNRIKDVFRQQV